MQKLDVINRILASLGERRVASDLVPHPRRLDILDSLDRANAAIQARGWWCNRRTLVATPDPVTGRVAVVAPILTLFPVSGSNWETGRLQQQDGYLWDVDKNTTDLRSFGMTFLYGAVINLPFESLPHTLAEHIATSALCEYRANFDQVSQVHIQFAQGAAAAAIADDTRNGSKAVLTSAAWSQHIGRWRIPG